MSKFTINAPFWSKLPKTNFGDGDRTIGNRKIPRVSEFYGDGPMKFVLHPKIVQTFPPFHEEWKTKRIRVLEIIQHIYGL